MSNMTQQQLLQGWHPNLHYRLSGTRANTAQLQYLLIYSATLLDKFWRTSLYTVQYEYVTDDAIEKVEMVENLVTEK